MLNISPFFLVSIPMCSKRVNGGSFPATCRLCYDFAANLTGWATFSTLSLNLVVFFQPFRDVQDICRHISLFNIETRRVWTFLGKKWGTSDFDSFSIRFEFFILVTVWFRYFSGPWQQFVFVFYYWNKFLFRLKKFFFEFFKLFQFTLSSCPVRLSFFCSLSFSVICDRSQCLKKRLLNLVFLDCSQRSL